MVGSWNERGFHRGPKRVKWSLAYRIVDTFEVGNIRPLCFSLAGHHRIRACGKDMTGLTPAHCGPVRDFRTWGFTQKLWWVIRMRNCLIS